MNKKIITKITNTSGETLVETLAALLIAAMGLALVPGAVYSAARVNKSVRDAGIYTDAGTQSSPTIPTGGKLNLSVNTHDGSYITVVVDGKEETSGKISLYYYTIPAQEKTETDPAAGGG